MAQNDVIELSERLIKYATGQFDPALIHTATLRMLTISSIHADAFARCNEYLTTLDLSRNLLTTIRGLEHLNALVYLDLSFNQLTSVHELSKWCPSLEVLHLEGNCIASMEAIGCFDSAVMPKLRALYLQDRDGEFANPVCCPSGGREEYVAFAAAHFQHIRCLDGHYFNRHDVHPRYVQGSNDEEVKLPDCPPWIGDDYFGNALLEAAKI
ncbi:leucine-rich repeat protein, putative, partial [Bodo saltans]